MPTLTPFQTFLAVLAARVTELLYAPTAIRIGAHVGKLLYGKAEASRRASREVGELMLHRAMLIEKMYGNGYILTPVIAGIAARGGNMLRFAGMSQGEIEALVVRVWGK